MTSVFLLIPLAVILLISAPLLIYHFLIFPNVDGVIQNITWYVYDDMSQHFVYWFFFWGTAIGGALTSFGMVNRSK